jgi:hypothetical protein
MIDKPELRRFVFTDPDGGIYKRSDRVPALWALVAKPSYEDAVADAKREEGLRERYRELTSPDHYHPAYALSILDGATSEDDYVARFVAIRLQWVEDVRAKGVYERYTLLKYLRTPEVPRLPKYYHTHYVGHTVLEGEIAGQPLPRSEQRLNAALAGNPYSGGVMRAAWAAGVRHGFAMAYKPGKTVNGVYMVPTDV